MRLILASGSKQRQAIFDMIGLKYDVITSDEEEISNAKDPSDYVKDLSLIKANSVAKRVKENAIIISADTIIYMNGKIYEKPKTKEEAFLNIKEMSGKLTYAYTGVTIKDLYKNKEVTFSDVCKVYLKKVNDDDIKWYVENEKTILERGIYTIPGKASLFLDRVEGDFYTLVGISPGKIYDELKKMGYKITDFELE